MSVLVNNPWIVYAGVFGLIAAVVWLVSELVSGKRSRAEQRLEEFRDPMARKKRDEAAAGVTKNDTMARMLQAASPALSKPLQPKTEKERSKLKLKLGYAGFRGEGAPQIFLMMKIVMLGIGLFLGG